MHFLYRRFVEYFVSEIALSLAGTYFLKFVVKTITDEMEFGVMLLCLLGNIIYIYGCLMAHIYWVSKRLYFKVNLRVFIVFATINIVIAMLNLEPLYTWIFLPYNIFTIFGKGKVFSAVIVNLIMLFFILIVPRIVEPSKRQRSRGGMYR